MTATGIVSLAVSFPVGHIEFEQQKGDNKPQSPCQFNLLLPDRIVQSSPTLRAQTLLPQ